MRFPQCGMYDQQMLRPACAYAQSDQSLCKLLEYSMSVKLLTEQHLEFLSLKGGYTGSSESIHVLEITCHGSYTYSWAVATVTADNVAADTILVAFSAGSENVPVAECGVHHVFLQTVDNRNQIIFFLFCLRRLSISCKFKL